ncbi:unnamed protein product [Soboliphyme baturini]|uniref:Secreted protein n=1 Tax=Soboliphyme baturini TaxID=241478 RepID=A0A183IFC8_9BILA|nr:unnamed protein product [Soboliphyme baturini]
MMALPFSIASLPVDVVVVVVVVVVESRVAADVPLSSASRDCSQKYIPGWIHQLNEQWFGGGHQGKHA